MKSFNMYIEALVVADNSIYEYQKVFAQTDDMKIIFFNMKIYYIHFINEVMQFYFSISKLALVEICIFKFHVQR